MSEVEVRKRLKRNREMGVGQTLGDYGWHSGTKNIGRAQTPGRLIWYAWEKRGYAEFHVERRNEP